MPAEQGKSTREKAASQGKDPPHVVAQNVGSVGSTLDNPVERLRAANPEKEYRYVYAPEHRSDYSKVIARRAQGYKLVDVEAEEIEDFYSRAGSEARVGDVVLCEIPKDKRNAREQKLADRAEEDARRSQVVFEEHIRRTRKGGLGPTPVGSIERTSREYSVEVEE